VTRQDAGSAVRGIVSLRRDRVASGALMVDVTRRVGKHVVVSSEVDALVSRGLNPRALC